VVTPAATPPPEPARLAELVGALSLATDLAAGFALETALRTSLIAVELARAHGVTGAALRDIYYTGLLRFIGCTAFSHEQAWYGGGDDLAWSHDLAPIDVARPGRMVATIVTQVGRGAPAAVRARAVARTLGDPAGPKKFATAHCDLAVRLATHLGMSERVVAALGQIYERWDGRGNPHGVRGDALELPARLMHVAWRAEVHRALEGPRAAVAEIEARAGGELDPELATRFVREAPALLADSPSLWDAFLAAEPRPVQTVTDAASVAEAFARFVDIKSPFTLAHSTRVAALAAAAAAPFRVDPATVRVAGLLHDLGRCSVPNGIWDKPGPLNAAEWERVRLHAYQSERILARSPLLAPYAAIVGHHHERPDGSGYHRGGTTAPREARLLAAADAFAALTEERAHRPARGEEQATRVLLEEARAGRHDAEAVEAVLAAAGRRERVHLGWPAGLSDREIEVLVLLARGLSNKEIAARLAISAKTVQHHVAHIYEKTRVSTRAAAALFAVEHALLAR